MPGIRKEIIFMVIAIVVLSITTATSITMFIVEAVKYHKLAKTYWSLIQGVLKSKLEDE